MKLIIQIPCYNEAKTLAETVRDLPRKIDGIDEIEIMVIDDGSSDNTVAVAEKLGVHHIVRQVYNKGLAKTFMNGINHALKNKADIVVNTDGDNQYCGGDIEKLVRPIVEKKADIVMLADDHRFVALNVKEYRVIDNTAATARGFAAGLDLMAGGLSGEKCLVIGCGPVGQAATVALLGFGAVVSVYDRDRQRSMALCKTVAHGHSVPVTIEKSFESALETHRILFDATNSGGFITEEMITPDTFIAAPGMPLGLSNAARIKIGNRLLHDPLQTGVACMAVSAVSL